MFLAKLIFRPDARASFWKEKFLFGVPRALNEKVQESLREKNNGTIPYADLTYGDLISEVKKEGLKLCSQLILHNQVKKDLKASRKDLGSYCAQYGIVMPIPPFQISKKQKLYWETSFEKFKNKKEKPYKKFKTVEFKQETSCYNAAVLLKDFNITVTLSKFLIFTVQIKAVLRSCEELVSEPSSCKFLD